MFPTFAAGDAYAAPALRKMDVDVSPFLRDKPSVFGVLSRTQVFRQLASDFFERYPYAIGANLGCGLTHYFQWLDNHTNHWLDADVAQVMRLRKRLLPASNKRHLNALVDLSQPGWWQRLGLPERHSEVPVLLMCEGVLMYLDAHEVEHVLREFGQNAPAGSEMLFDTLSWLAIGCAAMHPSVCHTHAEFKWGSKHMRDFTAPHPRLALRSEHSVMDAYDVSMALACTSFRALWGVPLYGIVRLNVRD
ncbi:MAG: class I SAM-dependent methyltransferase [Polaromonas sp.]|nr:class I SAM-dependent methyltransferase [Polaromonas sp.]